MTTTQEFLDAIEMKKQNILVIKLGSANFALEQIRLASKKYKVSSD